MRISKFASTPERKPFHSSGYAEVANAGSMGATSAQSFHQRRRIEKNRQVIQQYRDSYVANGSHLREELQRRLDAPQDVAADKKDKHHHRRFTANNNRQAFNSSNASPGLPPSAKQSSSQVQRTSFKEPPKRGFNPYG